MGGRDHDLLDHARQWAAAEKWEDATRRCHELLAVPAVAPEAAHLLACIAHRQGQAAVALEWMHHAAQSGNDLDWWFDLGVLALGQQQLAMAVEANQQVLAAQPDRLPAACNLASALDQLGEPQQALAVLQAAKGAADDRLALFLKGQILRHCGQLDESVRMLQAARQLAPQDPQVRWNLALSLLQQQTDWASAWSEYEWRSAAGQVALDPYPQPCWQGESLAGKTILIHSEQGIGDEILFASCYDEVLAQAARAILVCDPRLVLLFQRRWPQAQVVGHLRRKDRGLAPLPFAPDFQIAAGSLSGLLRRSAADFPRRAAFLAAEPLAVASFRKQLLALGTGKKLGISWQAGGHARERAARSLLLAQWLPLLATPGVVWIDLQYGEHQSEIAELKQQHGITIHTLAACDPLVDLDTFAALLTALDGVVSVANATVHLAGALGVRCWGLAPFVPNWRWGISGAETLWYSSIRLIRQPEPGDWHAVLVEAARQLGQTFGLAPAALHDFPAVTNRVTAARIEDATRSFQAAYAKFQAGDHAAAERICGEIVEMTPRKAEAWQLWGMIAQADQRHDLAARLLERAVGIASAPGARFHLAQTLAAQGKLVEAIEQVQFILNAQPDWADGYEFLGTLWQQLGNWTQAERAFQAALDRHPFHESAWRGLVQTLCQANAAARAIAAGEQAVALLPQVAELHHLLGMAYLNAQRPQDAYLALGNAVTLAPQLASAWWLLGQTSEQLQRWQESARAFEQAHALAPTAQTQQRLQLVQHRLQHSQTPHRHALVT